MKCEEYMRLDKGWGYAKLFETWIKLCTMI